MVGDHTITGDSALSSRSPKNGLSCKLVLQAVGKVLRRRSLQPYHKVPPSPDSDRGSIWPVTYYLTISRAEFRHSHLRPRPVDHHKLIRLESQITKGDPCFGILQAIEPLRWGMVRTEGEGPSMRVVLEGEDRPFNGHALLLSRAVLHLLHESFRLMYSTRHFSPSTTWDNTAPNPLSDLSIFNKKMEIEVRGIQEQPTAKCSFHLHKCLLTRFHSLDRIWCLLFSEIGQLACEGRIIKHKSMIIASQLQDLSYLLFGLRSQAGCNRCSFINLGPHLPITQVKAQIP